MARPNRSALARSLALPRAPLRGVYPVLRYGAISTSSGTRVETPSRTDGLLDAAVDWAHYCQGRRAEACDFTSAVESARDGNGFVWLGLHEPSTEQLAQLGQVFSLHPLALEDASSARQRPKIERHESDIFLAMRTLAYVDRVDREAGGDVVETGAVMVFLGEYFVITIRHGKHASMSGLRKRLEENPQQLALGPSAVLHAVTDKVVDDYLAVVDSVQQDLEEIETTVFAPRAGTDIERIYQLKRDIIEMKRTVRPLAAPLRELSERPRRMINPEIREYFRDVTDHLTRVHEQVASFDELLTSILQAGLARVAVAENEDMRKISAWVSIAAVPTMIAGIYGMNFEYMPPEMTHQWGYPAVLTVMTGICATMFRGFKRNGWL
ncbi:MAG TPA: magnesium and cobalt transport protein CorA [Kineosporiaceae bacterium]|nr:magnesium and cobalt transport protein CorA [Kineosporiaceae bacterium]